MPYLLKPGTSWNNLKPPRNDLKPPETTHIIVFLLKISYSQVVFALILHPKVFLGENLVPQTFSKMVPSSPNWLKYGTGVHCYIFISNLMLIFSKYLSLIFFWANLVPKFEVFQIEWNFVQGYIATCLLRFSCLFFQNFVIHIILGKFGPKI